MVAARLRVENRPDLSCPKPCPYTLNTVAVETRELDVRRPKKSEQFIHAPTLWNLLGLHKESSTTTCRPCMADSEGEAAKPSA